MCGRWTIFRAPYAFRAILIQSAYGAVLWFVGTFMLTVLSGIALGTHLHSKMLVVSPR